MAFKMNYNKSTFPFKETSSPNKFINLGKIARSIGGGFAGLVSGKNKGSRSNRGGGGGFNPLTGVLGLFGGRRRRGGAGKIASQERISGPVNNFDPLESMYADAISKHTTTPPLSKKYKYKK